MAAPTEKDRERVGAFFADNPGEGIRRMELLATAFAAVRAPLEAEIAERREQVDRLLQELDEINVALGPGSIQLTTNSDRLARIAGLRDRLARLQDMHRDAHLRAQEAETERDRFQRYVHAVQPVLDPAALGTEPEDWQKRIYELRDAAAERDRLKAQVKGLADERDRMIPFEGRAIAAEARLQVLTELCDRLQAEVERLTEERDEARDWVRRMHREAQTLTCVYCGHAYPPGTPTSGSETLTEHIRICEKHPLRQAEARVEQLQAEVEQHRRDLWLSHGHSGIYGDDGEMQCSRPPICDYKRDPLPRLVGHVRAAIAEAETRGYERAKKDAAMRVSFIGDGRCADAIRALQPERREEE